MKDDIKYVLRVLMGKEIITVYLRTKEEADSFILDYKESIDPDHIRLYEVCDSKKAEITTIVRYK